MGYRLDIIVDILLIFLGVDNDSYAGKHHYKEFQAKVYMNEGCDICNSPSRAQEKR